MYRHHDHSLDFWGELDVNKASALHWWKNLRRWRPE